MDTLNGGRIAAHYFGLAETYTLPHHRHATRAAAFAAAMEQSFGAHLARAASDALPDTRAWLVERIIVDLPDGSEVDREIGREVVDYGNAQQWAAYVNMTPHARAAADQATRSWIVEMQTGVQL